MNHKELFKIYTSCEDKSEVFKYLVFIEEFHDSIEVFLVEPYTFDENQICSKLTRILDNLNFKFVKNNFLLCESDIFDRQYYFCKGKEDAQVFMEKIKLLS